MTFPAVEFVDERGDKWRLRQDTLDPDGAVIEVNCGGPWRWHGQISIPLASLPKLSQALASIQAAMAEDGRVK